MIVTNSGEILVMGLFSRPVYNCAHCGKQVKEKDAFVLGWKRQQGECVLCTECFGKMRSAAITDFASEYWSYEDYLDYLKWYTDTANERDAFTPTYSYNYILLDTVHGTFSINGNAEVVFRLPDLERVEFSYQIIEAKEGLIKQYAYVETYMSFTLRHPRLNSRATMNPFLKVPIKSNGNKGEKVLVFPPEYDSFAQTFMAAVQDFAYSEEQKSTSITQTANDIQMALALFMFDSMEEVTIESLRKQRNTLIKAFHPDNAEENESYSKKINAAYETLLSHVSR